MIKHILTGILIGIIVFPTITLGGTFISSLIEGKTIEEAVQILAEQFDSIIGRVEVLESNLAEQRIQLIEQQIQFSKDQLCREAERLFFLLPPQGKASTTEEWIGRLGGFNNIVDLYNATIDAVGDKIDNKESGAGDYRDLPIVEEYFQSYLDAKTKCEKVDLVNQD